MNIKAKYEKGKVLGTGELRPIDKKVDF